MRKQQTQIKGYYAKPVVYTLQKYQYHESQRTSEKTFWIKDNLGDKATNAMCTPRLDPRSRKKCHKDITETTTKIWIWTVH